MKTAEFGDSRGDKLGVAGTWREKRRHDGIGNLYRHLRHRRFHPARHEFTYPLFMVFLDVDRLPELMKVSHCGIQPAELVSYQERDHFGDPRNASRTIGSDAHQKGVVIPEGRIFLLTISVIWGTTSIRFIFLLL